MEDGRIDDLELMDLHLRALFTHDAGARLLRINEPGGGAPAPRLFLGRTQAGNVWRFSAALPESLTEELSALCADEPPGVDASAPRHVEAYMRCLEKHAPVRESSRGPAYHIHEQLEPSRPVVRMNEADAALLRGKFEELVPELATWQPFLAIIENGRAVSVCRSVRITAAAHEAGVETLPEFRGRGLACDVTAAWASEVRWMSAVPLYSTSWENVASQGVARKLRMAQYGTDFQLE
jgi:hypothetical protein